jgi:hypothetical protein
VAKVLLPIQEAIRDLVGDLLGKPVGVDKLSTALTEAETAALVAYRDDEGTLMALISADRDLVAILGATLVMVPAPGVAELMKADTVPEHIYENFYEVSNIMTSLINRPNYPHLRQVERLDDPAKATGDIREVLDAPAKKRSFTVTVVGYGAGRMTMRAA